MSKQSHKYITDVWSFLWGLESELIWPEHSDTCTVLWLSHRGISPVAQREGHGVCRPRHLIVPSDFSSARGEQRFLSTALKTKAGLGDFCVCTN